MSKKEGLTFDLSGYCLLSYFVCFFGTPSLLLFQFVIVFYTCITWCSGCLSTPLALTYQSNFELLIKLVGMVSFLCVPTSAPSITNPRCATDGHHGYNFSPLHVRGEKLYTISYTCTSITTVDGGNAVQTSTETMTENMMGYKIWFMSVIIRFIEDRSFTLHSADDIRLTVGLKIRTK